MYFSICIYEWSSLLSFLQFGFYYGISKLPLEARQEIWNMSISECGGCFTGSYESLLCSFHWESGKGPRFTSIGLGELLFLVTPDEERDDHQEQAQIYWSWLSYKRYVWSKLRSSLKVQQPCRFMDLKFGHAFMQGDLVKLAELTQGLHNFKQNSLFCVELLHWACYGSFRRTWII